ncbi:MAG: CAP domain-containing protein [Streptococcus sp.]
MAALEQAQPANSPVQLSQATYEGYLQHLAENGNEAAAECFSPLSVVGKKTLDSWRVWILASQSSSPLKLRDAINSYRRNAGLPELSWILISFLPVKFSWNTSKKANWHMFKYLPNENIAYGFSPAGAVDFWYNEKAAYQEVAAQYGLPTDETQIDANDIYMKIGAEAFAKVGHYLQMVNNKATSFIGSVEPKQCQ